MTGERLIEKYRKSARRYDFTSRLNFALGPQRAHRRRAVQALQLRPGDTVVEVGCGTGLNFPLLEQQVGPGGRIIGVDLTDAMLAQARRRVESHGWSNISLVQSNSAEFEFPQGIDAILATYAHSLLPECRPVVARGAAALRPGGRWVVLDVKMPDYMPRWAVRLGVTTVGRFTALGEWTVRRPWTEVRLAMETALTDLSWTELFFGVAYLAAGSRGLGATEDVERVRTG